MSLPTITLRTLQLLLASTICGLSISLAVGHHTGKLPTSLGYIAFVGAASLVAAFLGVASIWWEGLQGLLGLVVDSVVVFLNVAGGVWIAIQLRGTSCKGADYEKMNGIDIIKGGKNDGYWEEDFAVLVSRCKKATADLVLMFLTVVLLFVVFVMGYIRVRTMH